MPKTSLRPAARALVKVPDPDRLDQRPIEWHEYLAVVADHRRLVLAIAVAVTLVATAWALLRPPVYESNMLIHVAGERAGMPPLFGQAAPAPDARTALPEIELLRSRRVIEPVVARLGLDIETRPQYLPLFGAALARTRRALAAPGILGHGGWCWGAEAIRVTGFDVPDALHDEQFIVTAGRGRRFRLTHDGAGIDAWGTVGTTLALDTAQGQLRLHVQALDALPGARFVLARRARLKAIERVQGALVVSELGKQSGMISASFSGTDPGAVRLVLSQVGKEYLRQHASEKGQQAAQSLAVLEAQLPGLKRRMEAAEASYNTYRNLHGTADFAEETRLRLQRHAAAEQRLAELQQRKIELGQRLGRAHPLMAALTHQIRAAVADNEALAAQIRELPTVSQQLERLAREVKGATDLYNAVLRNAEELRVLAQDTSSNVRLVDAPAMPLAPTRTRVVVVAIAALLGLALGVMAAFVQAGLRRA